MGETYDDDRPTHRWVRVGYAKTPDGQIDRERLRRQPEHLPADEAKRIVRNGHGQYLTDEQAAQMQAERAEVAEAAKPAAKAAARGEQPADLKQRGWGATTDTATKEG